MPEEDFCRQPPAGRDPLVGDASRPQARAVLVQLPGL